MKSYYFFGCWFWILPYNLLLFIKRKENLKILVDFTFWIVIGARKSSWRINRMDDCHFKFFVTEIHIPIQFIISLWSNTPGTVVPPSFLLLKLYLSWKYNPSSHSHVKCTVRAASWPESMERVVQRPGRWNRACYYSPSSSPARCPLGWHG